KRFSLRLAVCAPAPVTHLPGSASGACFAGSHSPWPLPFAPPAPRRSRPLCSSASQLLWQSLTSRDRASSATAPRLPDADRRQLPNGRSRDLPVPAQGASAHARFFDHAGPFGPCDGDPKRIAFRARNGVSTRGLAFAAQWLAYALPYRRFVAVLADANARLGADVDRYSFIVVDLHHLLLAGLPAHFESSHPNHAVWSLCAMSRPLKR